MDTVTQPRGIPVTQSYHDAATIFSTHALKIMSVTVIPSALVFFLSIAVQISIIASLTRATTLADVFAPTHISAVVTLLLLGTIVLVQTIGVIALLYTVIKHETVAIVDAFEHALGFFWRFAAVAFTTASIGVVGLFLGFIPVFIIGILLSKISIDTLSVTFDWIAFLAPAIGAALSTYFIFAPYILIDKNCSIRTALTESPRLVRGHFWATALRLLLYFSAAITVIFILNYIPLVGPLLSLLFVTPFTIVYIYTVYSHLAVPNHS